MPKRAPTTRAPIHRIICFREVRIVVFCSELFCIPQNYCNSFLIGNVEEEKTSSSLPYINSIDGRIVIVLSVDELLLLPQNKIFILLRIIETFIIFVKKTWKVPSKDIAKAESIRDKYYKEKQGGKK